MPATVITILLADGRYITGAVHGSGGLIAGPNAADRIRVAIAHASAGQPTGICEPRPGHALVYQKPDDLDHGGEGAGDPVEVPLAHASVRKADPWAHVDGTRHSITGQLGCPGCAGERRCALNAGMSMTELQGHIVRDREGRT